MSEIPQPCAGGIVLDGDGRLLVIQRGQPPGAGLWSIPGGRCRPGEEATAACVREVAEETGLAVEIVRFAGRVERPAPTGTYLIDDFVCRVVSGGLQAGDDAAAARWVTRAELLGLPLVPGLVAALTEWDALPA